MNKGLKYIILILIIGGYLFYGYSQYGISAKMFTWLFYYILNFVPGGN